MAIRVGRLLACFCCSKQSIIAKEEEEVVIAQLSSNKHKLETDTNVQQLDIGICKQNVTQHA